MQATKKIVKVVRPTRSPRQQRPPCRTKNGELSLFLQSREQVVVRRCQVRRIGWVIRTVEAQVGQILLGCKLAGALSSKKNTPMLTLPRPAFFLQNVPQLHQQRWVILRIDSLALWKIINEEDAVLIPKNWGENFSSGFLHSQFFCGGVCRYAATPLIVALSPGTNLTTRFRPCSPIATGNHVDSAKKFQNLLRRLALLTFLIRVQAFRDPLRGELPHVQIFINDGPNPLTWDSQMLSYWFSRNPAVFQD